MSILQSAATGYVGSGLLGNAEIIRRHIAGKQVAIITNFEDIAALYLEQLVCSLGGYEVVSIVIPDGESFKNWQTLQLIFDGLLSARFDRKSTLVWVEGWSVIWLVLPQPAISGVSILSRCRQRCSLGWTPQLAARPGNQPPARQKRSWCLLSAKAVIIDIESLKTLRRAFCRACRSDQVRSDL